MTYGSFLLKKIAVDIGKDPSSVTKFIKILEENWCDTKKALESTTTQTLVEIGIPKFIALKIKSYVKNNIVQNLNQSNKLENKYDHFDNKNNLTENRTMNEKVLDKNNFIENRIISDNKINSVEKKGIFKNQNGYPNQSNNSIENINIKNRFQNKYEFLDKNDFEKINNFQNKIQNNNEKILNVKKKIIFLLIKQ